MDEQTLVLDARVPDWIRLVQALAIAFIARDGPSMDDVVRIVHQTGEFDLLGWRITQDPVPC